MRAKKGSQKWMQFFVNESPDALEEALRASGAIRARASVEWLSPLASMDYVEYRDGAFLSLLNVELKQRTLESFWPTGGPMWDALARTSDGDVLLVEAKAHIAEMVSPASRASPGSLKIIQKALRETQAALAPRVDMPWHGTFYQITNRLAHLYLLREINGVNARLVYLYVVGDEEMGGPRTREEWEGAIRVTEVFLGLGRHRLQKYIHHVFVDVASRAPGSPSKP